MSRNGLIVATHMTNTALYSFTMYAFVNVHIPMLATSFSKFDPGQFKYLTMWNLVSHVYFFFNYARTCAN